jgi:membrane-associated phospholipid phosphatase
MACCAHMNLATTPVSPPPSHSPDAADRAVRVAGLITCGFLVLGLGPMIRFTALGGGWTPLLLHLAALLAIAATLALGRRAPQVIRDWLPLALGPFLYIELRWLIVGMARPHADATVIRWEHSLFGGDPSAILARRIPSLPLSELLHLCYASYYALILLPPLILAIRTRRAEFARTLLALATVYALCFTVYLVFPVDGPRYLVGPAAAPEGPVRAWVLHLLAAGSSRGTAFPSSHVAASLVASLCALRTLPALGAVISLITVGLTIATVYGGFHYGVDVLAGVVTGIVAWALARYLWRRGSVPGTQSASAA